MRGDNKQLSPPFDSRASKSTHASAFTRYLSNRPLPMNFETQSTSTHLLNRWVIVRLARCTFSIACKALVETLAFFCYYSEWFRALKLFLAGIQQTRGRRVKESAFYFVPAALIDKIEYPAQGFSDWLTQGIFRMCVLDFSVSLSFPKTSECGPLRGAAYLEGDKWFYRVFLPKNISAIGVIWKPCISSFIGGMVTSSALGSDCWAAQNVD